MSDLLKNKKFKIFFSFMIILLLFFSLAQAEKNNIPLSQASILDDIQIKEVEGGLNLKITLENKGNQDYKNVKLTTEITGGFLFSPRTVNYTIPQLSHQDSSNTYTLQTQIIGFGLGILTKKPQISIILYENNKEIVIGHIEATIFGIRTTIKDAILNEENIFDGYTLFTPEYTKNTYLIDNKGEIVHQWNGKYIQGMDITLLEDGTLVRSDTPYPPHPNLLAGGFTGHIGFYNSNGESIWEYTYSNSEHCLHHGFEVLPNGNILMIAVEYKTYEQAIEAGRNPNQLKYDKLCPDYLIEVKPNGSSGGEIVWEWHVWDHLIQDFDSSKENYGEIDNNPELININYGEDKADFTHINSIDYNEEFDQILLSVREFNEIWIIDHSTSTEEAAGHTGGTYGKGGDILYRWGNPSAYDSGDENDQQLFAQHDAKWIPKKYPGEGNILIFNNQVPLVDEDNPNLRAYSSVIEIRPPVDQNGEYLKFGLAYGPAIPAWSYTSNNVYDFYSSFLSSAQRLPNGNTLILEGNEGRFFEVNEENEIVWQYTNNIGIPNHVFKIEKYSKDYSGINILLND